MDFETERELAESNERFMLSCWTGDVAVIKELCESHPNIIWRNLQWPVGETHWQGTGTDWLMSSIVDCIGAHDGTGLHFAACKGYVDCCRVLLDAGAEIDARDSAGRTPLMYASDNGVMELLLSRGANVRATDSQKQTALHFCAYSNWGIRAAQLLVAAGADKDAANSGFGTPFMTAVRRHNIKIGVELVKLGAKGMNRKGKTPLHWISRRGCNLVPGVDGDIEALVAAGADLEAVDYKQRTPLFTAASHDNTIACRKLLELGANPNAKSMFGTTPKCTTSDPTTANLISVWLLDAGAPISDEIWLDSAEEAFLIAAESGCERAVCTLIEAGVYLEIKRDREFHTALLLAAKKGHTRTVRALVKAGAWVHAHDKEGQGAYLLAAANGHSAVAAELIKLGVDANACDNKGNTALHLAAENGQSEMIRTEVERGTIVDGRNRDGDCPIHLAAKQNKSDSVRELVRLGADVDAKSGGGSTALHLAASNGHRQTATTLLTTGADIEARDDNSNTALLIAAKHGHMHTASLLICANAQVQATNTDGDSPLIFAAQHDGKQVIKELLEAGAFLSTCNKDGCTAILTASRHGSVRAVRTLIEAGADLDASNHEGNTPLLLSVKHGFSYLAGELIRAGANSGTRNGQGKTALALASEEGYGKLTCQLVNCGAKLGGKISFFLCLKKAVCDSDVHLLAQLVQAGASVNERGDGGLSCLHVAAGENLAAVRWLLDHGANVSATADNGFTPLHSVGMAGPFEQVEIVELLLARGADPTAESKDRKTPLDLAKKQFRDLEVQVILEKAVLAHELIKEGGGEAAKPTTVAVRLGGPPGAGKSTLAAALQVTYLRSFFRFEFQADEEASNMQRRTKGISCQSFTDGGSSEFAIFDLGGHGEFLATHQMFIGDGRVPVIDCVVVSALDDLAEEQAFKWCSLYASRNRPTSNPWPLLLIATRADKARHEHRLGIFSIFHKIKATFADYFRFPVDVPLFIDARKSWSELTINLRRTLSELHSQLINQEDSPRRPAICQHITELLPALRSETATPVVTKEKFYEFIQSKNKRLADLSTSALTSLSDKALEFLTCYATVLSFQHAQARNFVVVDPPWLLSDIVGRLMVEPPLPGPYIHYENGYAKKHDVIAALKTQHLPGETAFEMVASLGFCLEQKQLQKVLNPSKLRSARAFVHWPLDSTMVVNAGRRLKCKGAVAIASAFFPHLQVHFYHRYLTEYDEELPMWNGGIRLAAGERTTAEALIEAHPAQMSIDIIVRGKSGSERACTDFLHDLTMETLRKAVEISPGSQLGVFYLSRSELDRLSPAGLMSRPCVEYSTERVEHAVKQGNHVTDGKASSPENPDDLLLSPRVLEQLLPSGNGSSARADSFVQDLPDTSWKIILLNLAKGINSFTECDSLATGLAVNDREGDIVRQLREVNPHRGPPEVAVVIFSRWVRHAGGQTTTTRRATLHRLFREELNRPSLCNFLDDELKAAGPVEMDMEFEEEEDTDFYSYYHDEDETDEIEYEGDDPHYYEPF